MNLPGFLGTSTEWTPERFGNVVGSALLPLLLLLGIVKCWSIMQRPITNKSCVLALMMVLVSWLVLVSGNILSLVFQVPSGAVSVIAGFLWILFTMAALVLGIVGLATYDRARFLQGRAQAIWAIVLTGLAAVAMLAAVTFAAVKSFRAASVARTSGDRAGGQIETGEFNFAITPSSEWVELKPEVVNRLACLALRKRNPETYCLIIGERLPVAIELDQLGEIVKSNLAIAAKVLEQSEEMVELNGLVFKRVNTRAFVEASNLTLEYEHWIATRRGFSWQIVFWTPKDKATLAKDARKMVETFRLLDPDLDGAGSGALVDVDLPASGYRTKLEGLGWASWTDASGNALLDFRAQRGFEALVVVPLRFDSAPPDLKALTRGLLSTLDFEETPEDDFKSKPWVPDHGGTGRELEIERDVDGDRFRYILRLARGENSAHLIAGWAQVPEGDLELVRRSMDSIALRDPRGAAPPLNADQEKALGLLLNEAALSLTSRKENEAAAHWFCEGFKHGNDPTVLGNAGDAFERAGLAAKGRDLLAPHMESFPRHHHLNLHFARLQVLSGDADGGATTFLGLLEHGFKVESDLLSWLQLLNENEQYPAALRCVDAWVARHPTRDSRRWQAQTYDASGDSAKALALLETLHAEVPDDRVAAFALGECYNDAEEYSKAATIAETLLADGNESPRALMMLGWSQMGRKWYRDAKASFERAAKNAPDDSDIQNAIRRASAALGQGDNSDVKQPIAAVELPTQVASALAEKTVSADFGAGHPYAWLTRSTGYRFKKGEPRRRTVRRRVKILTAEGASEFSSVEAGFDPLSEHVFMNRLEVRNASDEIIAKASPDDVYVRDLNDGTASNRKVLHMQVAGVQPGTTVEWEVTFEDLASSETFAFERHLFASGQPLAAEAVYVAGDVESVRSHVDQGKGLKSVRAKGLAAWIVGQLPAVVYEPFPVPAEQRCPMLWLGGNEGSWEEVGQDYLKQIKDRLAVDGDIKDLAATLVEGKTTECDRIAAIVHHVQRQIAYKAIEFGVRARRPNTGSDTIRLRYGDCKDTALLTHLLLQAAGIESNLALVNTDWNTQPDLATLDQFNHMVVHVPSLGKNRLLNPTDKTLALAEFPADGLWHSHALVLDATGPRLIPLPATASSESCRVGSSRLVTQDGTDWRVQETLEITGYYASWMRRAFTGLSPIEQREKAQNILAGQGAAQVHEFHFENLDNSGEPARLALNYAVRDAVTQANGGLTGVLPALWEHDYLGTKFVKDRRMPFVVLYPLHFTSEVTVKLPSPPSGEAIAALVGHKRSEHCEWSLKSEARNNDVILKFDFKAKAGTHQPDRYEAFHESWESARRAMDKPLTW